jgi:hypothetical protein
MENRMRFLYATREGTSFTVDHLTLGSAVRFREFTGLQPVRKEY